MVGIKNFDRGQISIVYPAPARRGTSRQGPAKTCLEMGDWKYDILHSPAISDITTDVLWIEDVWGTESRKGNDMLARPRDGRRERGRK